MISQRNKERVSGGVVYRIAMLSLFGSGFWLTTILLRPTLPNDYEIAGKLTHLAESDDSYDCIVIGSSRLNRGLNPSVFDTTLQERGYEKRSFNLSVPGLRAYEAEWLVGQVDQWNSGRLNPRRRPSWLIVEVTDCYPPISPGMAGTDRAIHWHTLANSWNSIRVIQQDADAPISDKLKQLQLVTDAFLARSINHGRLIHKIPSNQPARTIDPRILDNDGFLSLDDERSPNAEARRKSFLSDHLNSYQQSLSQMNDQNAKSETVSDAMKKFYLALDRKIHKLGIQPIYTIPNICWGTPNLHSLGNTKTLEPLFSYNHLDRYPRLYEVAMRWDKGHLNAAGAEEFSKTIANDIAQFFDDRTMTPGEKQIDDAPLSNAANRPQ